MSNPAVPRGNPSSPSSSFTNFRSEHTPSCAFFDTSRALTSRHSSVALFASIRGCTGSNARISDASTSVYRPGDASAWASRNVWAAAAPIRLDALSASSAASTLL